MHEIDVPRSPSFMAATAAFLAELGDWADLCVREYDATGPNDGHDQVNFTLAWEPLIHSGRTDLLQVMARWRDEIREHFEENGRWHHGYWRKQEAHHGTEHFELFLGTLFQLSPDDRETCRQLRDACEHMGNWVAGVPDWFDWDRGVFRSMWLGTEVVRPEPEMAANVADHMRFVNLALLAYEATGQDRYFGLADIYGRHWAAAILNGPSLPVALLPDGPLYAVDATMRDNYHGFAGMAGNLADDVDRAENLLASGATDAFLALHRMTGQDHWLAASRRLLDALVGEIGDPDAGAAVVAMCCHDSEEETPRYEKALTEAYLAANWSLPGKLGIQPTRREGPRPPGIGKRVDKPEWFEDGAPRKISPLLVAAVAEIADSEELARQAVDLARAYFALGRQALTGDRRHACGADSDAAVARGHGRENNAGVATGVLLPLMFRFIDDCHWTGG